MFFLCEKCANMSKFAYNRNMTKKEHFKIWLNASQNAFSLNSILSAAGMSYFAFFSFFPLILLIVSVASYWFDPLWVESKLIKQLEFIVPNLSKILGDNIDLVIRSRTTATAIALILLAWASSGLFSIITRILDAIWSGGRQDVRSRLRYRSLALLLVGITSLLILLMLFFEFWIVPLLKNYLPQSPQFLYQGGGFFFSLLVNIILFALLYRFLPHDTLYWKYIFIGAGAAGLIWALAKRFFVGYVVHILSTSNLVYGPLSTIMAFMVWVYFSSLIFFFGAYLAKGYSEYGKAGDQEEGDRRQERRRIMD